MDHSEMKKRDSDSSGSASGDGSGSDGGGGRRNKGNKHQHCPSAPEYDISMETEHLDEMYGDDIEIVSDPFPQVTIKIRPSNERVSATLLVSCFRGYPSKCPELMIKSTKGLSKDDRDSLLSHLKAQAHALEGQPMILDLVMAAQDSLHDIDVRTSYRISRYKEDFEEITQLGSGAFGHAVLSKNKLDGRQYAIKKIRLDDKSLKDRILREVVTLSRLQHRHVVRYYQAWFETGAPCPFAETTPGSMTPANSNSRDKSANSADMSMHKNELDQMRPSASSFGAKGANLSESIVHEDKPKTTYLCIQMEYCKRTLHDMFQSYNLDEELAWRLFGQIVEGLKHIHREGIIHRDLTPKNIFLDDHDDVKIGDFGLAEFSKLDVPDTYDDPVDIVVDDPVDDDPPDTYDDPVDTSDDPVDTSDDPVGDDPVDDDPEDDDPLGDDSPVDDDLEDTSDDSPYGAYYYTAPEIKKESNIDEKVDIYSLGVAFFELWHPFHAQMERAAILDKLKNERELPSSWVAEFPEQASLLKQLISPNPSDRPSAADILHLPFSSNMKSESLYRL